MSNSMTWYQLKDSVQLSDSILSNLIPMEHSSKSCATAHTITPSSRGFAYGDGFFTTIGVHQSKLLFATFHQVRIATHLKALFLNLPDYKRQMLWQLLNKLSDDLQHGIIKIIITRNEQQQRGYAYSNLLEQNDVTVWIGSLRTPALALQTAEFLAPKLLKSTILQPKKTHAPLNKSHESKVLQQPSITAVCLKRQLACLPDPLVGLKTLNRLDSVMVAGELQEVKKHLPEVAEGMVQDLMGNWVEGVMSNVFYQLKDDQLSQIAQWYTPPLINAGVKGVMRQVVIERLKDGLNPVRLRSLKNEDLQNITSLFFCNAVRGIMPVSRLYLPNQSVTLCLKPFEPNK